MKAPINVRHLPVTLRPNASRVLVRPFIPAPDPQYQGPTSAPRALKIITRILSMTEEEVMVLLTTVLAEFGDRHQRISDVFLERFDRLEHYLPTDRPLSLERKLLIGSYFTSEYSLECAALFNPSIVPQLDQSGVPEGSLRFILSLRATGEGHISSITFRSGVVDAEGHVHLDSASRFVTEPKPIPSASYDRELFMRKLAELELHGPIATRVMDSLSESFTLHELKEAVERQKRYSPDDSSRTIGDRIVMFARSNYEMTFDPGQPISERIIFPFSPSQSNGIEDARFVLFEDESGPCYYATYTAYDGRMILPQMLETRDFVHFRIGTLNGPAVRNKGMALFPRKFGDKYCMLSRQDSENIHIMFSEHLHFWHESQVLMRPTESWEYVQLGNCGSPMETDAGWLVLTHGVGPMRKYCIGAILLDKDDPTKIIARLREPLLSPEGEGRDGYVPNVVYTCGAMIHHGKLILPYAVSDSASAFASVDVAELLAAMR